MLMSLLDSVKVGNNHVANQVGFDSTLVQGGDGVTSSPLNARLIAI